MALELLEIIPETDALGRFRDTAQHSWALDIATPLVRLGNELQRIKGTQPHSLSYRHYPRSVLDGCEAAIRGDWRPVDDYLDEYWLYTDHKVAEQRGTWRRNRLVIHAHVTIKDNLSVCISMSEFGEDGRWEPAPEWARVPVSGYTTIMQRPADEILFIRDVHRIFARRAGGLEPHSTGKMSDRRELFEAACELVNATFWLTVQRLARRFDVTLGHYLVLLRDKPGGNVLGLEIVDAVAEHKSGIQKKLAEFEHESGWSPEEFWLTCSLPSDSFHAKESLVRHLRTRAGGTVKLTAGEVERRVKVLSRAVAYGLWQFPTAPTPEAGLPAASTPVAPPSPEPVETVCPVPAVVVAEPELKPDAEQLSASDLLPFGAALSQTHVVQVECSPGPSEASAPLPAPRSRYDPPSYTGLKSAPWTTELQKEFGCDSTEAFVSLVNEIRRAKCRLPVPQGSFPKKEAELLKLVKEVRLAMASQQPEQPDAGSAA